jgi:hypothetical protein
MMKCILPKEIKMKKLLFFGWLLIPVLLFCGQITIKDSPQKGKWNFYPEKIWEIDKAGEENFGRIAELLISNHNIYVRDFENNISYIFDDKGNFIKKFAPQGNGEGQLSHYLNRFQAGDKIVLASPDKLHFFSQDGTFDHAVENNPFLRFPLYFLDENEFIYAPNFPQSPWNQNKLILHDLPSGNDKILVDFSATETNSEQAPQGPMIMIFSLTPQVKLACDGKKWYSDAMTNTKSSLQIRREISYRLSVYREKAGPPLEMKSDNISLKVKFPKKWSRKF